MNPPKWEVLEQLFFWFGDHLPKRRLVQAIQILSDARKRRFTRNKEPLYGQVFLGFEGQELSRFMDSLPSKKYRLLFTLQLILMLRIGEVVRIKVEHFTGGYGSVYVQLQKGGGPMKKPLPFWISERLRDYVKRNRKRIEKGGGYLFFSEDKYRSTEYPHLSPNYVRKVLRETAKKADMNDVYAISRNGKKLYRINSHSFKRTGTTLFGEHTGNLALTQSLTGHKSMDVLLKHYWKPSEKSKRDAIERVFGRS